MDQLLHLSVLFNHYEGYDPHSNLVSHMTGHELWTHNFQQTQPSSYQFWKEMKQYISGIEMLYPKNRHGLKDGS